MENEKIQVILAQCLQCGERFEKTAIHGKGDHVCPPSPSTEVKIQP